MAKKTSSSSKKGGATYSVNPIRPSSTAAKVTPSKGGAKFAPGSRPDVITQSGRNVFKNGKLVGSYADADKAAAAATEFNTNKQNIAGDTGGETFRTLNRVNRGTQTGKANLGAISENMAARGFLPTVAPGTKANPSPVITGALKTDQYMAKYGGRVSSDPMARIKAEQAAIGPSKALEDQALADALKSGSEGGANNSMPAGTDIPGKLEAEPGFKSLLQEQVYSRAYGKPYDPYPGQARTDASATDTAAAADTTDMASSDLTAAATDETTNPLGDSTLTDLASRFGIDLSVLTPDQTETADISAADTTAIDTQIDDLANSQYDTGAIEDAYSQEVASIEADKEQERRAAKDAADARYKERMAEFASLGGNPSSSAGAALENERQMLLDKFLSQIDTEESTAKATAAATRSTALAAANEARMTYLKDKRANTVSSEQTTYDRKRQSVSDAISNMNSVMSMMETGQRLTNTERDNTVSSLKTLLDNFGATALDGMNPTDLRKFEKALGVSSGTLRSAIAAMKTAAAKEGEKPELRDVSGSLYQLVYNATTQTWVPTLLIAKAGKSGSGSGSGGSSSLGSVGGVRVTDALKKAAIAAYGEAYGDSASAWVNLSSDDQEALISNYIYLGGTEDRSVNPFADARSSAETTYGSDAGGYQAYLPSTSSPAAATPEPAAATYGPTAPAASSAWGAYGISDPFSGISW